jgi:hypothetical protein
VSAATSADLQKFAVKVFARSAEAVEREAFVPIFHRWIQTHAVPGILVDVADYGHLPNGPGVVLIGHEADVVMDSMEGPLGLLYNRKRPLPGSFAERLRAALKVALEACARLEAEPELAGRLTFDVGGCLFIANDRLAAPNTGEAFTVLRPDLEAVFGALYGKGVELRHDVRDPRRRLAVQARSSAPADLPTLLGRLG